MFFKKSTSFIIFFVFLIPLLFTNNKPAITGVEKDNVQINIGSDAGVMVGITGKVFYYYMNINSGKKEQIVIASFRVEGVEKKRCHARLLEKKQNVEIGFWVTFDKELIKRKTESSNEIAKEKKQEPTIKKSIKRQDKNTTQEMELAFWESINDSKNPDDYQAYLNKFPNGTFAELARNRIKDNKKSEKQAQELNHRTNNYYSIQVGAYADLSNAKKLSEKYDNLGYQTSIAKLIVNTKKMHILIVGKFENINEAEKVKKILEERDERKYRIIKTFFLKDRPFIAKTNLKKKSKKSRSSISAVRLRSDYRSLSIAEVKSMLKKRGFCNSNLHNSKTFRNQFEKKYISGSPVVIDKATGLMWQQVGSIISPSPKFKAAEKWIKDLNRQGYAGYHDWRIPSLEEGASLLESSKRNGKLYIDPLFSKEQSCIWTGDQFSKSKMWVVNFSHGNVHRSSLRWPRAIRAVRSVQ